MSFSNRMRAKQSRGGIIALALIAATAIGAGQAPIPKAGSANRAEGRDVVFADVRPSEKKKSSAKRRLDLVGGDPRKAWDTKARRRRIIMYMTRRENSGRQWVRVRRTLRRSSLAYLLNLSVKDLVPLARENRIGGTFR